MIAFLVALWASIQLAEAVSAIARSNRGMDMYRRRMRWSDRYYIDVLGNVCDGTLP